MEKMETRLANLDILVDFLCKKPYLFGIRSSIDIFYITLGYCLCEQTNGIENDKDLSGYFCEYIAQNLISTKANGRNWGLLISFLSKSDEESISMFHSLYAQYTADSKYSQHPEKNYNNASFKGLVLKVIERNFINDTMALSLFIEGYDMAAINNSINDAEYDYYREKSTEIKEGILREFKLSTSLNCMEQISSRYYSYPKRGLAYFISKVWGIDI